MDTEKFEFIKGWSSMVRFSFPFVEENVADFIACQFALESSYGTSSLFIDHNNICGMKRPFIRLSSACNLSSLSSDDEFAHYYHPSCCLTDYFLLFQFNKIGRNMFESLNSFKIALKQIGYCPEMDYINKINLIYQQFKSFQS